MREPSLKKSNINISGLSYSKCNNVSLDYNLEKIVIYEKLFAYIFYTDR